MGLIGRSKRSVTDCQPTMRNIPEEQRSHLPCGRSWKSRLPEELKSHLSFVICFLQCRNLNLTLVGPCIIIQFKYINQPDATFSQVYYLDVYVSLNMFRTPPRPSSGAYNCINSLWFYLGMWW